MAPGVPTTVKGYHEKRWNYSELGGITDIMRIDDAGKVYGAWYKLQMVGMADLHSISFQGDHHKGD